MWILRYLNGYGDLVEGEFNNLDEIQDQLKTVFDLEDGPFAFKLIYKPKQGYSDEQAI